MYGPITTLRHDNRIVKHIPWSAFKLTEFDWTRVVDARDILGVRIINFYLNYSFIYFHLGFKLNSAVLLFRERAHALEGTSCS